MGISEKAIVQGDEILKYIPQRHPIVMIDAFFGIEGSLSRCGLSITEDNIFCCNGSFDECGMMEHVAQAAAFRTGYSYIERGEDAPLGFIGSIDGWSASRRPKVGEYLITDISVEMEVLGITLLKATVTSNGATIAECTMKVAVSENK